MSNQNYIIEMLDLKDSNVYYKEKKQPMFNTLTV